MAEIQIVRIRSVYGDIKGMLSQIPLPEKDHFTSTVIVNGFNVALDELSQVSHTDYSKYKVTHEARSAHWRDKYDVNIVRAQMGRVISRLEEEFGFGKIGVINTSPNIVIFNKNQNAISLQIDYTINDLIEKTENDEGKVQLRELRDELEKPSKNWEKIKSILIWILNFSKDLFIEVLPILLQKK